jgi:hypothetical protein
LAGQPHGSSTQLVLQLLSEVPAGQHVLLLVLHAADSSSFNRSLLGVMLARAERLLSSSPASLAAAGGLGQQAASLAALGSYCSYLCFVAGAVAEPSAAGGAGHCSHAESVLLQQQPVLDIAAFLARAHAQCSNKAAPGDTAHNEDRSSSWQLALSVPFACAVLRFAGFNPSAASSASVGLALQQLQTLQGLPCMSPTHEDFGRLPACLSSCLAGCHLLQDMNAGVHAYTSHQQQQEQEQEEQQQVACGSGSMSAEASNVLSKVVAEGSALVDDAYWIVCSPGLQQLTGLLTESSAAVTKQQQQQQGKGSQSIDRPARGMNSNAADAQQTAAAADGFTVSRQAASTKQDAQATANTSSASAAAAHDPSAAAADHNSAKGTAADNSNSSNSSNSSSPSGPGAPRHTTPLLLAPRVPPALDAPPACLVAALAAVGDPVVQQLQQAFIAQYSTDDNPVSYACCYVCCDAPGPLDLMFKARAAITT